VLRCDNIGFAFAAGTSMHAYRSFRLFNASALLAIIAGLAPAQTVVSGRVTDPQGKAVAGATVKLIGPADAVVAETRSDGAGGYTFNNAPAGDYRLTASAHGFAPISKSVSPVLGQPTGADLRFEKIESQPQSIVITAQAIEPTIDLRNAEVFNRTLFTRDDQVLQQLNAGINAGQHEGGGKSLEIRRFGFNLDHGGVNGGLKVLLDDVQQNQGSQGHGQGYLGSLKALSPELIQEVTIINGPFRAEYGDFSGLGVVHIRQRESMPDQFTARLEAGNFDTGRGSSPSAPMRKRSIPISHTTALTAMVRSSIPADTAATT
jgi:hypothetical protein